MATSFLHNAVKSIPIRAISNMYKPSGTLMSKSQLLSSFHPSGVSCQVSSFHTSAPTYIHEFKRYPESFEDLEIQTHKDWMAQNKIKYPPSKENEPLRPAEVVHLRHTVKYSQKKLWYPSIMIRGMSVDEAIKQLSFYNKKGANILIEIIKEAIEMAVDEHNVEYRSNLWIAECFVKKGLMFTSIRRNKGGIFTPIAYRHCDVYLRLREGRPPQHYYPPKMDGHALFKDELEALRQRRIKIDL